MTASLLDSSAIDSLTGRAAAERELQAAREEIARLREEQASDRREIARLRGEQAVAIESHFGLPARLRHLHFTVQGTCGVPLSREDIDTLLVGLRLGYAWSREEQEDKPTRGSHCRLRTERIRSLIVRIEEALDLPSNRRMLQDLKHPRNRPNESPRGDEHWRRKQWLQSQSPSD